MTDTAALLRSAPVRAAIREARATLGTHGVLGTLLAKPDSNPKLAKGEGLNVLSAPLHLAPASVSGFNTCAMATEGCRAACLHTAGNPAYMAGKMRARNARTVAFFNDRQAFMLVLAAEIAAHAQRAASLGMIAAVRLNATSDIPWERVPVTVAGHFFANVMQAFPNVTFYDYTKRYNRKDLPANYSLTFSLAENNDTQALQALRNGMNVAVVFNVRGGRFKLPLPATFNLAGQSVPVIDGDEHDFRPADARGVIVGLRAKGSAIGDTSGFVRAA